MNQELLNAATERFPNLTEAERRMLLAEKSEPANCGPDIDQTAYPGRGTPQDNLPEVSSI